MPVQHYSTTYYHSGSSSAVYAVAGGTAASAASDTAQHSSVASHSTASSARGHRSPSSIDSTMPPRTKFHVSATVADSTPYLDCVHARSVPGH